MMDQELHAPRCPIGATLDVVGDRWSLLVVRDLLRGRTKFSELQLSITGIASNVLTDRLRKLETLDIIVREADPSKNSARRYYQLTRKGHGLGKVIGAMSEWGQRWADHDLQLIDQECGHQVEVHYRCEICLHNTPTSRVRIVES